MKQRMSVTVRGREHEWSFPFEGDPKHLADWRADGLEINEVMNVIPYWVAELGLTRIWCRAQEAWRLLRLW